MFNFTLNQGISYCYIFCHTDYQVQNTVIHSSFSIRMNGVFVFVFFFFARKLSRTIKNLHIDKWMKRNSLWDHDSSLLVEWNDENPQLLPYEFLKRLNVISWNITIKYTVFFSLKKITFHIQDVLWIRCVNFQNYHMYKYLKQYSKTYKLIGKFDAYIALSF